MLGGPQNLSECFGEEINLLPLLGMDPCTVHPVAQLLYQLVTAAPLTLVGVLCCYVLTI